MFFFSSAIVYFMLRFFWLNEEVSCGSVPHFQLTCGWESTMPRRAEDAGYCDLLASRKTSEKKYSTGTMASPLDVFCRFWEFTLGISRGNFRLLLLNGGLENYDRYKRGQPQGPTSTFNTGALYLDWLDNYHLDFTVTTLTSQLPCQTSQLHWLTLWDD